MPHVWFFTYAIFSEHQKLYWKATEVNKKKLFLGAFAKLGNATIRRVCLYVCLYVCMSVCLYVCLSLCLSVCLSVCMPVCLSDCLYVCLTVCMSVCLSQKHEFLFHISSKSSRFIAVLWKSHTSTLWIEIKAEGKDYPITYHEGTKRGYRYSSTLSLTSALE